MSAEVVDLEARRIERSPHRSGTGRCLNCKHEWSAVAPIGTADLECPACSTFQGVFKGIASSQFMQWQCACGEYTFFLDEHGPYCAHCGIRPDYLNAK